MKRSARDCDCICWLFWCCVVVWLVFVLWSGCCGLIVYVCFIVVLSLLCVVRSVCVLYD